MHHDIERCLLVFRYAWTWSLILSDVSDDDAGEYTCRISSDDRTLAIIKRFNLTVLSKYQFLSFALICYHTLFLLICERCFRLLFDETKPENLNTIKFIRSIKSYK